MTSYIGEGNGPGLVVSCVVPLFFTCVFSIIRVYVRWAILKIWKIEDWFFVASQVTFTILAVCALITAMHGNGQHLLSLKSVDIPIAMQYWFVCELFYALTAVFIRLSIGFFLLRICTQRIYTWVIKITMGAIALLTAMYFFFAIFQCHPVSYFWLQFSGMKGACLPAQLVANVTIAYSVFVVIADLIFGILPIFVIWDLKMNKKAKIIVGGLLMLGILAGLTVIIRIAYIRKVNLTIDFLFATSSVSIWSIVEPAIGICCMAASTYRPLFKSLMDKASTRGGYGYNSKPSGYHTGAGSSYRMSRQGYVKSKETGVGRDGGSPELSKSNSFDDVIAMESFESKAERPSRKDSKKIWKERGKNVEGEGASDHGIMFSTTVEITRKSIGDDVV